MHRSIARIFAACAACACIASAHAGAGEVSTQVAPLSPKVTYSIPGSTAPPALVTYVGYTVTVANTGGNTINNIRFTGATAVTDGAEIAVFDSAEGANCVTTNAQQTAISCTIGQLMSGAGFPTFAVFFRAPAKLVNGVADGVDSDSVSFAGTTYFAEGTGGPNSIPQNSTRPWSAAGVTLGTTNSELVRSTVPKNGGTFYTGIAGVATPADPMTTIVTVPGRPSYTTAELAESSVGVSCSPNPAYCLTLDLKIPGTDFAFLEITLRRDASTIARGAKIADAQVFYTSDLPPALGTPIGPCGAGGVIPTGEKRCIFSRQAYTKRTAPAPDFEGDWEIVIRALENGRMAW